MTVSVIFSRFDFPLLKGRMLKPLQWCVILIGVSVPVSVALDNVLLALLLLGALFGLGSISRIAVSHPVARASALLFFALLVAMFYGATPLAGAFSILGKYADLLFVPVFIFLLTDQAASRNARRAFMAAMAITLALSYLLGTGMLQAQPWMNRIASVSNPVIFHSHITQNNMMAFAVFLALLEAREAVMRARLAWGIFALLGMFNVLFMVQGRTGYLVLLVLLGWFAWTTLARRVRRQGKRWGWKQGLLVVTVLTVAVSVAYQGSQRLHDRVTLVVSEYQDWREGKSDAASSTGQRLSFYSNTLEILKDSPLLGVGTGGFPAAFAQQVQGTAVLPTHNPHNEYLMVAAQTGIVGLALLLYLFYTLWRTAPRLPIAFEQDAARGLVLAYLVNCSLNSALLDHSDGLFFAFMTALLFANLKQEAKHD